MGFGFRVDTGREGRIQWQMLSPDLTKKSRQSLLGLSFPHLAWMDELKSELARRQDLQPLINKVRDGEALGQLFISAESPLMATIVSFVHNYLFRISRDFYWQGMRTHIKEFVAACLICQRNKVEQLKPAGMLQPLPVSHHVWTDISMDFVEGLPSCKARMCYYGCHGSSL